jgi:hypothetical protein
MNLKSIKLDNYSYHEYLAGKDVTCPASSVNNKDVAEGEHILVYKDTVTANASIAPPKSEMQSEYIGVEGEITGINTENDQKAFIIRKI